MKLFLDFLPLILFFGTFQYADKHKEWAASVATSALGVVVSGGVVGGEEAPVLLGTIVMSVATLIQVAILKVRGEKVHLMLWITFVLVLTLGSATVYFHNPMIIKWKPSLFCWAVGLSLWVSRVVFGRNPLQEMMGAEIDLPAAIWQRLSFAWIAFMGLLGLLNLYVVYNYSTSAWATFKVFGMTGLSFVFSLAQVLYMNKHMAPEKDASEETTT